MSLLRHSVSLFERLEAVESPVLGTVYRIRPSDGDGLSDSQQRWWLLVSMTRDGDGVVAATIKTSFDGLVWYTLTSLAPRRSNTLVELVELNAFAPLLRVETQGGDVLPKHALAVRLASDGPFVAAPV